MGTLRYILILTWSFTLAQAKPLHPFSDDVIDARTLSQKLPLATSTEIAARVMIGQNYKSLINWMHEDLKAYLANFDAIFDAKLARIRKHEKQRISDRDFHTENIRKQIEASGSTPQLITELERLNELHKEHAFVATYTDAHDFNSQFVGPKRKLLKAEPTKSEIQKMNQKGEKELFVDTWAVPFFNTGTQTRAQAKKGVKQALKVFDSISPTADISLLQFTKLMALFARPEFNDVRRFKLLPFPSKRDLARFGKERSDAKTFGDKYPNEAMVVTNRPLDLGPVSFIFGQRVHLMGLISHSLSENTADGRIFTGPADFLEHDWAHAFFNLSPNIPGTAEEWEKVHREFMTIRDGITDPRQRKMERLVYYHFTHESGFRVLLPGGNSGNTEEAFANELSVIKELLGTRYHYDFMLKDELYKDGHLQHLEAAFANTGKFFFDRFTTIATAHQRRCADALAKTSGNQESAK